MAGPLSLWWNSDLHPGPSPTSRHLMSILGPRPLSRAPDLHVGLRPPSCGQDSHARTQTYIPGSELNSGPRPSWQDPPLGPSPPSRALTSILGLGPLFRDPDPHPGLRPTSGSQTFMPGPRRQSRGQSSNPHTVLCRGPFLRPPVHSPPLPKNGEEPRGKKRKVT